jgi:hypothetical protein
MALVPIFHGFVTDDGARIQFEPREDNLRRGYLKRLAGQPVDVVVKVHRNKRSDKQNAWWWTVPIPLIAAEVGYDKHEHEMLHYALVSKCFGTVWDDRMKQEIPKVRSSELTTTQFSELMEWVVRWAAQEYGIPIPLPNEAEFA